MLAEQLNLFTEPYIEPNPTSSELELVYSDSYMRRVADEDYVLAPIDHPLATYYAARVNDDFCGVFLVIQFTKYEVEIHSFLFKQFLRHSRTFGQLIIKECFKDPSVLRLTAWVYKDLPTACNYVKKLGFELEGEKKYAVIKNGEYCSSLLFGMSRPRYEELYL